MSSFWMPKKQPLYAPMIASFGGGSARGYGRGRGAGGKFPVGDRMVFTSARMMGPLGPSKTMTDAFYPYPTSWMDMFGTQEFNGYQKVTIDTTGRYRFSILGAMPIGERVVKHTTTAYGATPVAGIHYGAGYQAQYTSWSNQVVTHYGGQHTGFTSSMAPGYLVVEKLLSVGDEVHIQVGQGCIEDSHVATSAAGAGATSVFFGPRGNWENAYAIAGGMGGYRTNYAGGSSASLVYYGINGRAGYTPNGSTSFGGTNGTAGGNTTNSATPLSNSTSGDRSGGGAGLHTSPKDNNYFDNRTPFFSVCSPTALILGGMGALMGSHPMNPYDNTSIVQDAMYATMSNTGPSYTNISNSINISTASQGYLASYATNATSNMVTNTLYPFHGSWAGGFGGGAAGGWGGVGGGGGYSGGGSGYNNNDASGGAGSSHSAGCTFISHNGSNHVDNCRADAYLEPIINGVTQPRIMAGIFPGNGWVAMQRVA